MVDVLFETPPTSKWQVLLPQIVAYSYKQFFVASLEEDLSGEPHALWDSQRELVYTYGPSPFKSYFEDWWKPEIVEQVPLLEDMDTLFRKIFLDFETAIETDDFEKQTEIAELLDEDLYFYFQKWIPDEFKEYFFFPESVELEEKKLEIILERFKPVERRHLVPKKTRRVNPRRTLSPVRSTLSKLRKTRRRKQKENEILQVTPSSSDNGS